MRWNICGFILLGCCLVGCSSEKQSSPQAVSEQTPPSSVVASKDVSPLSQQFTDEAIALSKQGNLKLAYQKLTEAIIESPNNGTAFFERGKIQETFGQSENALADYCVAIHLLPSNAEYVNHRGFHYLKRNILKRAEQDFSTAINLDGSFALPLNNRALVYIAKKEFEPAIKDLERALEIEPEYLDALSNKGYAYHQSGRHEEALLVYDSVLKKSQTGKANVYNNRGLVYFQQGKFSQAAADFTEAIKLDENNPKYYKHRFTTYLSMKDKKQEAVDDFNRHQWLNRLAVLNKEVQSAPRQSKNYLQRAAHFEKQTEPKFAKLAQVNYSQAIKAEPRNSSVYLERAKYYFKHEEYRSAIMDCMQAIELDVENMAAYSLQGDAHLKLEEFEAACECYAVTKRADSNVLQAIEGYLAQLQQDGQQAEAKIWQAKLEKLKSFGREPALLPVEPEEAGPTFEELLQFAKETAEAK